MPSYKGKFKPKNYRKYKGDPTQIVYRSLWELKFMNFCDTTKTVIKWSSEEIVIPYKSPLDNRYHLYFPDFYMKVKEPGGVKEYLVEVKPKAQCSEPKHSKRKSKRYITEVATYAKNQAKWKAAREYCRDRVWDFKIITERELRI
jgi:hypothetical protein